MGDRRRGVYQKFVVKRTDGKHRKGKKHENCFYFVLDCDHDPHAKAALRAYADSCLAEYPLLARDIFGILREHSFGASQGEEVK